MARHFKRRGSRHFEQLESRLLLDARMLLDIGQANVPTFPEQLADVDGTLFFVRGDSAELWKMDPENDLAPALVKKLPASHCDSLFDLTNVNGTLYFLGPCEFTSTVSDRELWKSDGTEEGTVYVTTIEDPLNLTAVGDFLFYTSKRDKLWRTDGTTEGTIEVYDFRRFLSDLTNINGSLYFSADESGKGRELWTSDGTEEGTNLLKDIAEGSASSFPNSFTTIGDEIYFKASSPGLGNELWRTDGTAEGTTLVADLNPGPGSSNASGYANVDGTLMFRAYDGTAWELFRSDGTEAGTEPINLDPLFQSESNPNELTLVGDKLFFNASGLGQEGMWVSDGTEEGTIFLAGVTFRQQFATAYNGRLMFIVPQEGNTFGLGISDGSAEGTTLVIQNIPQPVVSGSSLPFPTTPNWRPEIVAAGDALFFVDDELWISDGTEAGSERIDITPEIQTSLPSNPAPLLLEDDGLFFSTSVRVSRRVPGERGFWRTDGTVQGTNQLGEEARFLTKLGEEYFYFGSSPNTDSIALWRTDGKSGGSQLVVETDLRQVLPGMEWSGEARQLAVSGDRFYFAGEDSSGIELWTSDGTSEGTYRVTDLAEGPQSSLPRTITPHNGLVYFSANDGTGHEVWKSDGTEEGTQMVADVNENGSSFPGGLRSIGDTFFYWATADGRNSAGALYATDGSSQGTVRLTEPGTPTYFPNAIWDSMTSVNGELRFVASGDLWRSNGTSEGTSVIKDLIAITSYDGSNLLNGSTFFFADDGEHGMELWKSDGTESGTVLVKDIAPGASGSVNSFGFQILHFTESGFFFFANDGVNGKELWKSDGTTAGTFLVKDIAEGPGSLNTGRGPERVAVLGEEVVFVANGAELWKSDGTASGTVLVRDIIPDDVRSEIFLLGAIDNAVLFAADDGVHGDELWIYAPDAPRLTGDADHNGVVNFDDFLRLSQNFGKTDASWEDGDFDGDRIVTFDDFLALSANFGKTLDDQEPSPDDDAIQAAAVDAFFGTDVEDEVSNLETLQPTV